jgi:hypothetical protein
LESRSTELLAIAFKKIVFEKALLSGPGPFGREAKEREHFFRGIGKLEQCCLRLCCTRAVRLGVLRVLLLSPSQMVSPRRNSLDIPAATATGLHGGRTAQREKLFGRLVVLVWLILSFLRYAYAEPAPGTLDYYLREKPDLAAWGEQLGRVCQLAIEVGIVWAVPAVVL